MSTVRNSFAFLDDSDDDEPRQQQQQVKKAKSPAPPTVPAAKSRKNQRRDDNRRDNNRRDNNRRDNRASRQRRDGRQFNDGETGSQKYRRDSRRNDRRRDTERRNNGNRRREGNFERRGRNQYEKAHQKRGPKKNGHGGWGTNKDAVDLAAKEPTSDHDEASNEATTEEIPTEPSVRELTLEEHMVAEKERRAKFNERWESKSSTTAEDLSKEFSGMAVVGKKSRKPQFETRSTEKKNSSKESKSERKAKELKKAIFAEPKHFSDDGGRGNRGRGGKRGRGFNDRRRPDKVNTQDVNEFPALG